MAFILTEQDKNGVEKQRSTHDTLEAAMKEAENGYGSFLSQHWRRQPDSSWVVDERVTGGKWRIHDA